MNTEPTWAARFRSKVLDLELESGCLIWLGGITTAGYGNFTTGTSQRLNAHRAAWLLEYGSLPPSNKVLDHLCKNRWCVNVQHLEEVTYSENVLRGNPTHGHREDPELCKAGLHPWIPANLVKTPDGYTCRECKLAGQRRRYHEKYKFKS